MSFYYGWKPYVPVAARRAQAAKKAAKLEKAGRKLSPVVLDGRAIAKTFWGKAWCNHIESFSDYENRLPRGRTYARNGSIMDLQITKGSISALVMGSSLYELKFSIKPLKEAHWTAIKSRSAGQIDSLVELLQGKFSDAVMRVITDREKGLFPSPSEIQKDCSCPDWAGLCKHLAAVLYGIGARLDTNPELLFLLRGVDHLELLEGTLPVTEGIGPATLDSGDLAGVFGIEIAEAGTRESKPVKKTRPKKKTPAKAVPAKPAKKVSVKPAARKTGKRKPPEPLPKKKTPPSPPVTKRGRPVKKRKNKS